MKPGTPHTIAITFTDAGLAPLYCASGTTEVYVTPEGWLLVRSLDGSRMTMYPPHAIHHYTRHYEPQAKG